MARFRKSNGSIYNIGYHVIWPPKFRKSILKGKFKYIIQSALLDKSVELDITLEKYEIMPDHIHLFIKCKPSHKISNIVKHLKGYSSFILRSSFPSYRKKYKALWSPSYYCESVGHISENTIKKYIENQWINLKKRCL